MLYQMGCCVLPSSLRPIVLEWWRHEMERIPITQLYEREPYDHGHFTYGGYDHLPNGCYAQLERDPTLVSFCNRVLRPGWAFGKRSGDLVTRGCNSAQRLHSDWPQYPTESRRLGYALLVYIALHDVPAEQAAVRVVPWCTEHYHDNPYRDEEGGRLKGLQVPLRQGEMFVRDCRMAHAGMPNRTDADRVLPGIQILSPEWLQARRHGAGLQANCPVA